MGTLKIQMNGYLRERILGNGFIFEPVAEETLKSSPDGDPKHPVVVKTGDAESRIEVSHHEKGLQASFIYPLDSDPDKANGRLYAEDRFLFDPETKEFSVKRSFRMGSGAAGNAVWGELYGRLKELEEKAPLDKDDPRVKKFFNEVVLALPAPVEGVGEPSVVDASPFESSSASADGLAKATVTTMGSSGLKFSEVLAACLQDGASILLGAEIKPGGRASRNLAARAGHRRLPEACRIVDEAIGRASEGLTDPVILCSLLAGAAASRLGDATFRSGSFGLSHPVVSKALGAAAGLTLEAPVFEATHRVLDSARARFGDAPDPENPNLWKWSGRNGVAEGLLRSYATFGAFRAGQGVMNGVMHSMAERGFAPFGDSTSPIFTHGGSLAVLYGVNEVEGKLHLREREGPASLRLVSDAAFYAQMLLAGGMVEVILGPKPPSAGIVPQKPVTESTTSPERPHSEFPEPLETPLTLPAPYSPTDGAPAPEPPSVAVRKSYPPTPRRPPKSLPPIQVAPSTRRFATEIDSLNPDFENHFRMGMQVVPDPFTGEFVIRMKGAEKPMFSVKDESIYRAYLQWRERVVFEQEGIPGLAREFDHYQVDDSVRPLFEQPVLMPTDAVQNGQKNYYLGPLIQVADSPTIPRCYVFALVTEYKGGEMQLKKGFFYRSQESTWKSPVEGFEEVHLQEGAGDRVYTYETHPPTLINEHLKRLDSNPTVQLPMTHEEVMALIK